MRNKQGSEMKIVFAFALMALSQVALAQGIEGSPYIAVHGRAQMEVVPDIFPLEITLAETSTNTAVTQERIETIARRIVDLAQAQNIPDEDVIVGNLSINPSTKYDEKAEREIFIGNEYERSIEIRFRKLDEFRQFLSQIPDAKQLRLNTGNFGYSKSDAAGKMLTADAIADARATADELAKGINKRIVGAHTISNQPFNVRYSDSTTLDSVTVRGSRSVAPGAIALKVGKIKLDQDVYVIYQLAD
jgi:uncharacterized protein YggE